MVKFATSLFVAALITAPAFASVNWDQIDEYVVHQSKSVEPF